MPQPSTDDGHHCAIALDVHVDVAVQVHDLEELLEVVRSDLALLLQPVGHRHLARRRCAILVPCLVPCLVRWLVLGPVLLVGLGGGLGLAHCWSPFTGGRLPPLGWFFR